MKKQIIFSIILLFFISFTNAQWQQLTNGFYGGYIRSVATKGTTVFAGTSGGGIYASSNNGTNWTAINNGLINFYVNSIATNTTNVFAGTNGGMFLSTNNGANWSSINNGLSSGSCVTSIIINGSDIYISTNNGVFLTTNNGAYWSDITNDLPNTEVNCMSICGTTLYAGTYYDSGIYTSANNGTNWKKDTIGLPQIFFMSTTSFTVIGTKVFAGTNLGVFSTENNSGSWTDINNGIDVNVLSLASS